MKKFKFVSDYVPTNQIKDWLSPKTKSLKIPFKLEDIQPGTFSKSVMKPLATAKDGTRIRVRGGRYWIAIEAIENRKKNKKGLKQQVAAIKRRITILTKTSKDLKELRELESKLTNLEWKVKKL